MSSTHEAKVVRIEKIEKHHNADTLEVIHIWGYTSCARIGDFHVGDLAVFIEPDTIVPVDAPEFSFLAPQASDGLFRIRAKRLRGVQSFGLLIHARPGWCEGDNVFDELGCKHYEPPIIGANTGGEQASPPKVQHVHYDVESYRKHSGVIAEGAEVQVTEKIHGANARYVWHDGQLHCGSHTTWKKRDEKNLWWRAAFRYKLEEILQRVPDVVFYGEVYGQVQNLRYGATNDDPVRLAFFDVMEVGRFLSVPHANKLLDTLGLPRVPELYVGPWNPNLVALADGPSTVRGAEHIREGCVVKPMTEAFDRSIGRVILKIVSVDYLEGKKAKK